MPHFSETVRVNPGHLLVETGDLRVGGNSFTSGFHRVGRNLIIDAGNIEIAAGHLLVKNGDLRVSGNTFVNGFLSVQEDIHLEGADCAEYFRVPEAAHVEPGMALVVRHEDTLEPCEQAYDKRVAGIVSGAGNLRPGILLNKRDMKDPRSNRVPLAIVGKAYCKVDAQYSAIEVGDLLTTSPTPGHAMKATDPLKAFGAVLGKALRSLKEGQGMVPILITLQ